MQVDTEENARVEPRTVLSIILGGGAGTRLYPLTKRRAKPAVSSSKSYSNPHPPSLKSTVVYNSTVSRF